MDLTQIPTTELHHYLGARPAADDGCHFGVWAPRHDEVFVCLPDQGRRVRMTKAAGYHIAEVDGVQAGANYLFEVGQRSARPDPASRYQPEGVHGPSQVICRDFQWQDQAWSGVSTRELIIYELHVGTFTERGTFDAAIDRLDELVDLGVTAIELMPVADAAGRWNWGYDGVCFFAPNRNYGTPDGLRRLVNAAHLKGLAVILDVVYNHFGPEGNYLTEFGPYLSRRHSTTWGAAPNFDDPNYGDEVRRFFVANAIHWLDEYHIDGLRVDAIHYMNDHREPHVVIEMAERVNEWTPPTSATPLLIAESNVYDPEMTLPKNAGGVGFHAQWCDDFLHGVFAAYHPQEQLSHRTYVPTDLDQTLRQGFVHHGTLRREYERQPFDTERQRVPTTSMIYSIQNHDFIGNHPRGKRFHQLTSVEAQKAAAALLILCPAVPMLFMGEEFACEQSFQFFVDFSDPQLRRAVTKGRKRDYPQHDWSGVRPTDPAAFENSRIGPAATGNLELRNWYRDLIQLRKRWRNAGLLDDQNLTVETQIERGRYRLHYQQGDRNAVVDVRLAGCDPVEIVTSGELVLDSRARATSPELLEANHAKVFEWQ